MTREELESLVLEKLIAVAPDIAGESIDPELSFRDQFEFDSMDFLNFVTALHQSTGLEFPESDYTELGSLRSCVDYIEQRL